MGTHTIRRTTRVVLLLALALGLMVGTLAPAGAYEGTGGDDVETVRATVLETIDGKIASLTERQAHAETDEAWLVYAEGIARLHELRAMAADEDGVEALWDIKAAAKAVYNETVAEAERAGKTEEQLLEEQRNKTIDTVEFKLGHFRELRAGTDNAEAGAIYGEAIGRLEALLGEARESMSMERLRQIKNQAHEIYEVYTARGKEAEEKSPEDLAREALDKARRNTLSLIAKKAAVLRSAAESAKNPVVVEILLEGAEAIEALEGRAREADTVGQLEAIAAEARDIYEDTKAKVRELIGDDEDYDPSEHILAYLGQLEANVRHLLGALEETAELSPETWAAVVDAAEDLFGVMEAVAERAASGSGLKDSLGDMREAVHHLRKAVKHHVVAVIDVPMELGGMHIPG